MIHWVVAMVVTFQTASMPKEPKDNRQEIRKKLEQVKSRTACLKNCDGNCKSKCSTKNCECCMIQRKKKG